LKKILRHLFFFLSAAIAIPLAVLNRHDVSVSFIPTSFSGDPARINIPLFILIIICLAIGIMIGLVLGRLQSWRLKKTEPRQTEDTTL